MPTITGYYAAAAVEGAHRHGVNREKLLTAAGISPELLGVPGFRVDTAAMSRLIQSIWRQLGDEFMGFTARPAKNGTFAMMVELVRSEKSLDDIVEKGIRFYRMVTDDIQMEYKRLDGERQLVVKMSQANLDPGHFYLEFWLVIWHRFLSWLTGQQIDLNWASFDYAEPAHVGEFRLQFRCPLRFEASGNVLSFSDRYANAPPVRSDEEINHFLQQAPLDLLTMPAADKPLTLRVKTCLLPHSRGVFHNLDLVTVADALKQPPATLRRHLLQEGTSFQQIKDGLRRDIAIEQLSAGKMKVQQVAEFLGFSEPRSFTRAFKHWTGVSPGNYKR